MENIHVWVPDLYSTTGGIQTFSQRFIEALNKQSIPDRIHILVKNDLVKDIPVGALNGRVHVCGQCTPSLRTQYFAWECLQSAWRERPRLIISTHLHFGPLARLAQNLVGVPYVLVAHGIDAWRMNSEPRRKALLNANLVLAVSRYTREWLVQEAGLDADRVRILPNTFSPDKFAIRPKPQWLLEKYGLLPETPIILTVCRLAEAERYKGYDQIIRALPQVLRQVPNARYLLVGKGPDRTRIEALIAESGVQDAVILAGFVPDAELIDYYNLCDIFAMPSKAEGFGIVYLEALACGKPVLAGNKDGSRDAIADGELGILLDPDDTDAIANEMIGVLRRQHSHPNIFRPDYLRQRVTELYGFETFKSTVADRLGPLLNGRGNGH